jgi:DNA (cytosine-5)-methyltransferase 1
MGYSRAGFEVVGVDIKPQPHYPFRFIQADWEEAIHRIPGMWERGGERYAVHASPPCQRYSTMTAKWGRQEEHPDLVEPVQVALRLISGEPGDEDFVPYVIENVPAAELDDPMMLCGSMFGLGSGEYRLRRHRIFESNIFMLPPATCNHEGKALPVYGHAGGKSRRDGLTFPGTAAWREGMGIDWMTGKELAESIPPAFTEYIGYHLMVSLGYGKTTNVLHGSGLRAEEPGARTLPTSLQADEESRDNGQTREEPNALPEQGERVRL